MTRHHPLLVPAMVAPGLAVAIVAAAAAIILTRPAHGQECRYSFQCPFVASAASKPPVFRYRHTERRVHHHVYRPVRIARDTLTDADRAIDDGMPLVWPVLDDEMIAPEPLILPVQVRTVGIVPAVFIQAHPQAGNKPDPPAISWAHTHTGKQSIVVAFCVIALCLFGGSFPRLNGATI